MQRRKTRDKQISPDSLEDIENFVTDKGCLGGCLSQTFDESGLIFEWIAWTGNIRGKLLKIFYKDQGVFVRKDEFQ